MLIKLIDESAINENDGKQMRDHRAPRGPTEKQYQ